MYLFSKDVGDGHWRLKKLYIYTVSYTQIYARELALFNAGWFTGVVGSSPCNADDAFARALMWTACFIQRETSS
ncbi:hypothetical protein GGD40_005607 [Paraburkholderia bryophila]|uniref:Uncharacterized protein n=1 Tax=Paraburkholderia bryophila TaxID=420952 RepID=A0A7Y9WS77_9BURK|nr:hypothetical protein [Paraburkholderia bryophila]